MERGVLRSFGARLPGHPAVAVVCAASAVWAVFAVCVGVSCATAAAAQAVTGSGIGAAAGGGTGGSAGLGASIGAPASVAARTVRGQVRNASTGAAISRALVTLNGRGVLTDGLGRFEFPEVTSAQAFVMVRKPGYSGAGSGQSGTMYQHFFNPLGDTLDLMLKPDALVTGLVTGPDGQPIEGAQVSLNTLSGDAAGHHMVSAGISRTDRHGAYRFDVPEGQYRISLRYTPRLPSIVGAMLPVDFPETGTGGRSGDHPVFAVSAGEERRVDLRPDVRAAAEVRFRMETPDDIHQLPQLTLKTGSGSTFSATGVPTGTPDEFRVDLPSGSYLLRASLRTREEEFEAETRLTVGTAPMSGLMLHLVPVAQLTVEQIVDPSDAAAVPSGSGQRPAPDPQAYSLQSQPLARMNLHLEPSGGLTEEGSAPRLLNPHGGTFHFLARTGTYRLAGGNSGDYFVKSASYGTTDLLAHDLVVSGGGVSSTPIRIVISRKTGIVAGTVRDAVGNPAEAYVYTVAHEPSLSPVTLVRAFADGHYQMYGPPGSYSLYAFSEPFQGDLGTPTGSGLAGRTIEVSAGTNSPLDLTLLDLVPRAVPGGR